MILDYYFRRPVLIDYLISLITTIILFFAYNKNKIIIPNTQDSYSLTGDLTNIALTLSGFILTILTVLITFKDSTSSNSAQEENTFNKFFNTGYYYETIKHLKNCIKSIVVISVIGFFIKLFVPEEFRKYFFFFNTFGIVITILTIWRCLLVLSKILSLQKNA